MHTRTVKTGSALVVVLVLVSSASALTILPNDDTFIDETAQGSVRDAPTYATAGLYMKNQSGYRRVVFMEYTIPNVTVTSATFNATYFRSQSAGSTGAWTFRLIGSTTPAQFDETTLTWTNANAAGGINSSAYVYNATGIVGNEIALGGGNSGTDGKDVTPNVPIVVDITPYFNAHKGETIVFKMNSISGSANANAGGSFQDRELSRSMTQGGAIPAGPFIEYIPEPATALLLIVGSLALRRRGA
jgi:hypothetical protein